MTGVTKMGANEYLYQYKISNKSEELIEKKLYNVDHYEIGRASCRERV